MKKTVLLLFLCAGMLAGCSTSEPASETIPPTQPGSVLQIANPWKSYDTLEEAEAVAGFSFPIPRTVADTYQAVSFRVMNNQLLEVIYDNSEYRVTIRMQPGEEPDISGVYESFAYTQTQETDGATVTYKNNARQALYLVNYAGNSFSVYAPDGFWGISFEDFFAYILGK